MLYRHMVILLMLLGLIGACSEVPSEQKNELRRKQEKSGATSPERTQLSEGLLRDTESAQDSARSLLDLRCDFKASLIPVRRLPIPGLGRQLDGIQCWRVEAHDVKLRFRSSDKKEATNPYINDLEMLVEQSSGRMLTLRFASRDRDFLLKQELPNLETAETLMRRTVNRYVGLPTSPPKLTIRQLLQKAYEQGFAQVHLAKEIRIKRIIQSREGVGEGPRTVWVVNVRGIPPIPGKGPGERVSPEQRSHLRLVYDEDGNWLFADNLMY